MATDRYKLVQVHMLCRHGARTPIHVIPDVDEVSYNKSEMLAVLEHTHVPFTLKEEKGRHLEHPGSIEKAYMRKVLKGGCATGQLTVTGQQQAYDFGVGLRRKFLGDDQMFLSQKYSREDIYLRSTNIRRTIETVRCVVAGIYGKSELYEPLVIHTVNDKDEYMYPNHQCEVLHFLANRDWIHYESPSGEMATDHQMLSRVMTAGTGKKVTSVDYVHFRDDLVARTVHGLPIPDMLKPHYECIDKHAVRMFLYQCVGFSGEDTDVMLKISAGPILRRVHDEMDKVTRGSKTPKMYLYAVHDSSIVPLLVAFRAFDNLWPPFLASISFELYEGSSDDSTGLSYFIKVSYCDKPIIIPGCTSEICPYNTFWKALADYEVPSAEVPTDCNELAKHQALLDAYLNQLKTAKPTDTSVPAGM